MSNVEHMDKWRAVRSDTMRQVAGGPTGGDNGGMEARVAKLEAAVEHIQRDIADVKADVRQVRGDLRTQFYWVLAGFAAVLGVLAKGFGWM